MQQYIAANQERIDPLLNEGRKRRVDFPRPMVALLRAVQAMPAGIYDRFANRVVNG